MRKYFINLRHLVALLSCIKTKNILQLCFLIGNLSFSLGEKSDEESLEQPGLRQRPKNKLIETCVRHHL